MNTPIRRKATHAAGTNLAVASPVMISHQSTRKRFRNSHTALRSPIRVVPMGLPMEPRVLLRATPAMTHRYIQLAAMDSNMDNSQ
ncbi:hypothetical protein HMPREF0281_00774 [Corynebacterium ammoniagenes DSM 20306]|uniref:Uncharacterized protein n=1 Tax=Corynebacterium ammoniagenes DSM 20306 TaxID=649754 RepID=A0ABN0AGM9_CORAM|nr:hypothetical protein HMPREF0281_00774 [Corynebacterium ammoniagenes DSM 20306]